MAGTRGRSSKTAAAANNRSSGRTRSTRQSQKKDADIPDVFQDLLSEAASSVNAPPDEDSKPLKKRKTTRTTRAVEPGPAIPTVDTEIKTSPPRELSLRSPGDLVSDGHNGSGVVQTVTDYSEESEESEFEWEDVGIDQNEDSGNEKVDEAPAFGDLSIVIGGNDSGQKARRQVRRKGITAAERKLRLDVHKMHILCLLYHVHLRNAWCNDHRTQVYTLTPEPSILLIVIRLLCENY
jgi:xeroderma pigmentosum group C-complementing protein